MARQDIDIHTTLTRQTPYVEANWSGAGDTVIAGDDAAIPGYTRDDIIVLEATGAMTVTIPVNGYARGRTNDVTVSVSGATDRIVLPCRLFPPELFQQADGSLHIDWDSNSQRLYRIRAENPYRGGNYDGAASAGSRDALTVNEYNDIGDVHRGTHLADGDALVAANDAYLPHWSPDDILIFGTTGGGDTWTIPVLSANPAGRTNDVTDGMTNGTEALVHCGLLEPTLFEQGGLLHVDIDTDTASPTCAVIRARHIW